jgi:asparagine synthase (glutamine-hydrolysing)
MAWGLEARVPFLDKAFLEVAMNVTATEKMFSKGTQQKFDSDGKPIMEKVMFLFTAFRCGSECLTASRLVHPPQSLRLCSRWEGAFVI